MRNMISGDIALDRSTLDAASNPRTATDDATQIRTDITGFNDIERGQLNSPLAGTHYGSIDRSQPLHAQRDR